jgi:hypothetical protein
MRAWHNLPLFFGALVEDIVDEPSFRMLAPSLARRLIPHQIKLSPLRIPRSANKLRPQRNGRGSRDCRLLLLGYKHCNLAPFPCSTLPSILTHLAPVEPAPGHKLHRIHKRRSWCRCRASSSSVSTGDRDQYRVVRNTWRKHAPMGNRALGQPDWSNFSPEHSTLS